MTKPLRPHFGSKMSAWMNYESKKQPHTIRRDRDSEHAHLGATTANRFEYPVRVCMRVVTDSHIQSSASVGTNNSQQQMSATQRNVDGDGVVRPIAGCVGRSGRSKLCQHMSEVMRTIPNGTHEKPCVRPKSFVQRRIFLGSARRLSSSSMSSSSLSSQSQSPPHDPIHMGLCTNDAQP